MGKGGKGKYEFCTRASDLVIAIFYSTWLAISYTKKANKMYCYRPISMDTLGNVKKASAQKRGIIAMPNKCAGPPHKIAHCKQ
jgi:hypothetical protein